MALVLLTGCGSAAEVVTELSVPGSVDAVDAPSTSAANIPATTTSRPATTAPSPPATPAPAEPLPVLEPVVFARIDLWEEDRPPADAAVDVMVLPDGAAALHPSSGAMAVVDVDGRVVDSPIVADAPSSAVVGADGLLYGVGAAASATERSIVARSLHRSGRRCASSSGCRPRSRTFRSAGSAWDRRASSTGPSTRPSS